MRWSTPRGGTSPGRSSPATACSWATSPGPTWPSRRRRERATSSEPPRRPALPARETEVWPATSVARLRRPRHGHEGVLNDRLRAAPQRAAQRTRTCSWSARSPRSARSPPNFQAIVALNRGPLLSAGVEGDAAHAAPGRGSPRRGRPDRGRAHRPAVRRGAHPGRGLHHDAPSGFPERSSPGWPTASRRSCSWGATITTRSRGAACHGCGHPQARRLPRGRHDELARRAPRVESIARWTVEELAERAGTRADRGQPRAQRVGRAPRHGARSICPTTTSSRYRTRSTPPVRWRRSAPPGSAAPPPPACSRRTACAR